MFAIKKMREIAGMTQQEVADALGIKKPRYGDWERETREINLRDAIRLADLFGCTLDELANHHVERAFPSLSPAERELLDAYRASDDRGRGNIADTAAREKSASERDVVRVDAGVGIKDNIS